MADAIADILAVDDITGAMCAVLCCAMQSTSRLPGWPQNKISHSSVYEPICGGMVDETCTEMHTCTSRR